jgi:hypothetical protein
MINRSIGLAGFSLACAVILAGCSLIATVFKTGVWVGVLGVIAVIAIIVWLLGKALS